MPAALDALRRAQEACPPLREISIDMEDKARELGLDPAELGAALNVDRATLLLSTLKAALPDDLIRKIDAGDIAVGEIGATAPGAFVERIDPEGYLIEMNSGLFEFIYRMARPVAAAVFRTMDGATQGIERSALARILAEIMWWHERLGTSFGPAYEVTRDHISLANRLAINAELFLLAHELGHVHAAEDPTWQKAHLSAAQLATAEEHVADGFALQILLGSFQSAGNETDGFSLGMLYAGAEFALQMWRLFDLLNLAFVDGVHPSSNDRIQTLRSYLGKLVDKETHDNITVIARLIEGLFDEVAEILNAPREDDIYEREATQLLAGFERLLDQCAGQAIPDYVTFYPAAIELLSNGYPESFLRDVFARIAREFAQVGIEPVAESVDQHTLLVRFNKYKLLFGLIDELPDGIADIYREKLSLG